MPNAHRTFKFALQDDKTGHKSFEMPGAKPHYNPDRPGQVEHIALDLSLDVENKICEGTCKIRINPVRDGVSSLTLDAVNQQIESVKVGTAKQDFDYDGEQLVVRLKKPTIAGQSFSCDRLSPDPARARPLLHWPRQTLPRQTYPGVDPGRRRRLSLLVSLLRLPRHALDLRD